MAPIIKNAAQIAAAQQANAQAQAKAAEAQARAAAADAARKPVLKQSIAGISGINKAVQAANEALSNPKSSQATINKALAESKAALAAQKTMLATITPEQKQMAIEQGNIYTSSMGQYKEYTDSITAVPDPIYQTITEQYTSPEEIQAMINAALEKQKTELLGEQKKLAEQQKKTALEEFKASLTTMGLADLTDTIDEFIKNDYTASQIKLELPKTTAYKTRFPGMEALKTANRAINEATYISNERAYLQTLRAYGLDTATLGSLSALGTYIANEVSPREFEERVNLASDRVTQNPDVLNTFKSYYPEADKSSVVAYLLNPKAGIDLVKKQVRVAEIGAAAVGAGFKPTTISTTYGETLVPDTGDKSFNTIRAEFQKAKQLSDAQRSLAQIEGQTYSDVEAIEGVVGGDTQKLLASQQRAEREIARFSSRGGVTGSSLGSSINV